MHFRFTERYNLIAHHAKGNKNFLPREAFAT